MSTNSSNTQESGSNAGKPWSLYGHEEAIYNRRHPKEGSPDRWEQIAADLGASKQGVINAYNRFVKEIARAPETSTGP